MTSRLASSRRRNLDVAPRHHRPRRDSLCALSAGLCLVVSLSIRADEPHLFAIAGQPLASATNELPFPRFPVVLYRIEEGGLRKVRTVVTQEQNALVVRAYPEQGYVLVVSEGATEGSFLVDILELRNLSKQRSADFDVCSRCVYHESYLLQRHGRLVFYIGAVGYEEGDVVRRLRLSERRNLGMDLVSGDFVRDIDHADLTHVFNTGAQSGGIDGDDVVAGIFGHESTNWDRDVIPYVRAPVDLDWRLPQWLPAWSFTSKERGLTQVANNDRLRVLETATGYWLVFDKATGRWSRLEPRGRPESTSVLDPSIVTYTRPAGPTRLLGRWLAYEVWRDGDDPTVLDSLDTYRSEPFLSASERFGHLDAMPTGQLWFYDTRGRIWRRHHTGDPDSEILLIDEHDTAYFRVGDELRRADLAAEPEEKRWFRPATDYTLANELVAKAPEFWGVHWLVRGFE